MRNHIIKKENNFYYDNFNVRKVEHISLSQQTDITNNIIDTNTQTTNYIDSYLNNNKIGTILNPTPSPTENYFWIPEVSDNVAPGLDLMITYTQSKYATSTALQNPIRNISNTIQTRFKCS